MSYNTQHPQNTTKPQKELFNVSNIAPLPLNNKTLSNFGDTLIY